MQELPPPLEKELPSPNEKLLKKPTFWEKQGKTAKWLAIGSIILFILVFASALLLKSQKSTTIPTQPTQPPTPAGTTINSIEISTDKKSILDAETKEAILHIEHTKQYLKNNEYLYNPDTFQTTNAKYDGNCFGDATLSNKKDRVVFSAICLAGDLPQPWTGSYKITQCPKNVFCDIVASEQVKFLTSGSGKNFVWSQDDTTITYEVNLGLSGMIETRTINSQTGDIMNGKTKSKIDTSNWKTYTNLKNKFELKYPSDLQIEASERAGSCPGCADGYKFKPGNIQITIGGSITWEAVMNQFTESIDGKSKDITINNISGISREGKITKFSRFPQFESQEAKEIILSKKGIIFDFFTIKTDEIIFDQIISTFKFLNQTPNK